MSQFILKFCTEHGSDTAVLCAKFQNDFKIELDVMDNKIFMRLEFEINFCDISYTRYAKAHRILHLS